MSIHLTVAAHTNVGKTTLVRTLLKRDIGEVADRPHVTEAAERHTLIETPQGEALYLWDTPGFGDSARLLRRLSNSGNPIGWLQTQVWDRLVDRPFFCSQQAIRSVRDASDVVLYLVNAAEDPSSVAYIAAELQILEWVGKPVLLLLNQAGSPRAREAEAADEARWTRHLAKHTRGSGIIALDAFARCWVQEDRLLRAVKDLLSEPSRAEMERLRGAWRERNLDTFRASMRALAQRLAETAADRESVQEKTDAAPLAQRLKGWIARARDGVGDGADPAVEGAIGALMRRLDERVQAETDELIALHGLAGRARQQILTRIAGQFEVAMPADVASTGLVGGLLTGAAGGLAADLSTGGLSLGAGMVIGALLGALGAGGAARAYNLVQGQEDGRVRWSGDFFLQHARASLLRYLAVAHYGRGRGDWVAGEAPAHWLPIVDREVRARQPAFEAAWREADEGSTSASLVPALEREFGEAASAVLRALYPDAAGIFASPS